MKDLAHNYETTLVESIPRPVLAIGSLLLGVFSYGLAAMNWPFGFTTPAGQALLLGAGSCFASTIGFSFGARRIAAHLVCTAALISISGVALGGEVTIEPVLVLPFVGMTAVVLLGWISGTVYSLGAIMVVSALALNSNLGLVGTVTSLGTILFGLVITAAYERNRLMVGRQLFQLAAVHPLTTLPTRAVFESTLARTSARIRRRDEKFGVIFIDVNGLKTVNDKYGHAAGDALLIEVAKQLTKVTRTEEQPFHLSGDEFVILVENADEVSLAIVESRIESINRAHFNFEGTPFDLSVSFGSALGDADSNPTDVVNIADHQMYLDKTRRASEASEAAELEASEAFAI